MKLGGSPKRFCVFFQSRQRSWTTGLEEGVIGVNVGSMHPKYFIIIRYGAQNRPQKATKNLNKFGPINEKKTTNFAIRFHQEKKANSIFGKRVLLRVKNTQDGELPRQGESKEETN